MYITFPMYRFSNTGAGTLYIRDVHIQSLPHCLFIETIAQKYFLLNTEIKESLLALIL
jgi:hypothetical protein